MYSNQVDCKLYGYKTNINFVSYNNWNPYQVIRTQHDNNRSEGILTCIGGDSVLDVGYEVVTESMSSSTEKIGISAFQLSVDDFYYFKNLNMYGYLMAVSAGTNIVLSSAYVVNPRITTTGMSIKVNGSTVSTDTTEVVDSYCTIKTKHYTPAQLATLFASKLSRSTSEKIPSSITSKDSLNDYMINKWRTASRISVEISVTYHISGEYYWIGGAGNQYHSTLSRDITKKRTATVELLPRFSGVDAMAHTSYELAYDEPPHRWNPIQNLTATVDYTVVGTGPNNVTWTHTLTGDTDVKISTVQRGISENVRFKYVLNRYPSTQAGTPSWTTETEDWTYWAYSPSIESNRDLFTHVEILIYTDSVGPTISNVTNNGSVYSISFTESNNGPITAYADYYVITGEVNKAGQKTTSTWTYRATETGRYSVQPDVPVINGKTCSMNLGTIDSAYTYYITFTIEHYHASRIVETIKRTKTILGNSVQILTVKPDTSFGNIEAHDGQISTPVIDMMTPTPHQQLVCAGYYTNGYYNDVNFTAIYVWTRWVHPSEANGETLTTLKKSRFATDDDWWNRKYMQIEFWQHWYRFGGALQDTISPTVNLKYNLPGGDWLHAGAHLNQSTLTFPVGASSTPCTIIRDFYGTPCVIGSGFEAWCNELSGINAGKYAQQDHIFIKTPRIVVQYNGSGSDLQEHKWQFPVWLPNNTVKIVDEDYLYPDVDSIIS